MLLSVCLLVLHATPNPGLAQSEIVQISACETLDHWRGVTLIDDAKVGEHAVRYQVPAGKVGGCTLAHGHAKVDWSAGGELRFWYRFSGAGSSTLMVKLVAYPFAGGMQATWQVDPPRTADGEWHLGVVDLSSDYMRWGETPDKTSKVMYFRTQATQGSELTLDLDDVQVVPRLFGTEAKVTGVADGAALITLELTSVSQADETLAITAPGVETTVSVAAGATVSKSIRVPLEGDWLAKAKPLDRLGQKLSVAAIGKDFSRKELIVSIVKPLDLPPHPRLLFAGKELPALREKAQEVDWAKAFYESEGKAADAWLDREVVLPPRGGQWWHWYACKKDGARLKTLSPTEHQCPVCKEVYSGWPWDDVILDRDHNALSRGLRTLGLVYQLTGDARYAAKGREILLAYADRYEKYPRHNIHGDDAVGGGRVGPQTLDESTWLIPMCQGADMIWDTLNDDDRKRAEDGLFRPAAQIIRDHRMGIHNIQCWKNSAVGLVGLLLGDAELVWDAVKSPHGYEEQIAQGVTADGQWYEGAWGYHFYTVMALWGLAEAGQRCGIDTYAFERDGRSHRRLFDGPLDLAMPNYLLPAFNDSGTANVKGAARFYECALAHYGEARFAEVVEGSNRRTLEAFVNGVEPLPKPPAEAHGSRNFPGAGYAVLQHGDDENASWLCMKYGPHGGGHGHPDKLNFVFYAKGQILGYDPGTAAYGVPIQKEWYRTTLAHNTLTVDQKSQTPAEGRCLAFATNGNVSAVLAEAGDIYDGVTYRRAVAMFGQTLVLILDLVDAEADHVFDLSYHNAGNWTQAPSGEAVTMPDVDGYKHLQDMVKVAGPLPAIAVGDGPEVAVATASLTPAVVWAGTGVGRNTTDRVPCVVVRTNGREALVAWAIAVDAGVPTVEVPAAGSGGAVQATLAGKTYRLTADPDAETKVVAEGNGGRLTAP